MTEKRYFVTCAVGDVICELISRKLSDDEFEHLTYYDIVDRLNQLTQENEQLKKERKEAVGGALCQFRYEPLTIQVTITPISATREITYDISKFIKAYLDMGKTEEEAREDFKKILKEIVDELN